MLLCLLVKFLLFCLVSNRKRLQWKSYDRTSAVASWDLSVVGDPFIELCRVEVLIKKRGENLSHWNQVQFLTVQGKSYTEAQLILDEWWRTNKLSIISCTELLEMIFKI